MSQFLTGRNITLAAGILTFIAALRLVFTAGLSNNTLFVSGISISLLGYGWFFNQLIKVKWLNITICAIVSVYLGIIIFIAFYGRTDTVTYQEDAALVLGSGIRGEKISLSLKMRLDRTVEYHRKNPNALIIVTGGQGPREAITEALAMERYLIGCGVDSKKILRDDAALSTYENVYYSKKILDNRFKGDYTTAIITSDFHMYRSIQFARLAGLSCTALHSGTPWYTLPTSYVRECAAVFKLWLIKR